MSKPTKKILGGKKPSKTRKNRKPLKKNKRKNIKKGGFRLNDILPGYPNTPTKDKFFNKRKKAADFINRFRKKHWIMKGQPSKGYLGSNTLDMKELDYSWFEQEDTSMPPYRVGGPSGTIRVFDKLYNGIEEDMNNEAVPESEVILEQYHHLGERLGIKGTKWTKGQLLPLWKKLND